PCCSTRLWSACCWSPCCCGCLARGRGTCRTGPIASSPTSASATRRQPPAEPAGPDPRAPTKRAPPTRVVKTGWPRPPHGLACRTDDLARSRPLAVRDHDPLSLHLRPGHHRAGYLRRLFPDPLA